MSVTHATPQPEAVRRWARARLSLEISLDEAARIAEVVTNHRDVLTVDVLGRDLVTGLVSIVEVLTREVHAEI